MGRWGLDQEGLWMPPWSKWESPSGLDDKYTATVSQGGPCNTQSRPKSAATSDRWRSQCFTQRALKIRQEKKRSSLTGKICDPIKETNENMVNQRNNQRNGN